MRKLHSHSSKHYLPRRPGIRFSLCRGIPPFCCGAKKPRMRDRYSLRFGSYLRRLRPSRTAEAAPSRNTMPLAFNVASTAAKPGNLEGSSTCSIWLMVKIPTWALWASSRAVQPSRTRPSLTCLPEIIVVSPVVLLRAGPDSPTRAGPRDCLGWGGESRPNSQICRVRALPTFIAGLTSSRM
jgi:hypothetical protein